MSTPGVTLSGVLQSVAGAGAAGSVVITLVNIGDNPPLISGSALLAPLVTTAQADSNGIWSCTLWGNYQISPANTYYQIQVNPAGSGPAWVANYQFNTGGSFDLSTLTPVTAAPLPLPPFVQNAIAAQSAPTGKFFSGIDSTGTFQYALPQQPWLNVLNYGAVGDAKTVVDAGCHAGNGTITSATATFTPADVGKQFSLTPTQYDTSAQTTGTITAYVNSTTVTVSINSVSTASNCRFTYGTDNTVAIQAAITAAQALARGGDGTSGTNSTNSCMPAVLIPPPASGIGYIISGPLNITKQGLCISAGSVAAEETSQLILNHSDACINFTAPLGTYHTVNLQGVCLEGNFVANYGIYLNTIEESTFTSFRINNCLVAAVALISSNLTRWYDVKGFGNAAFFLLSNSNNNEFFGLNIFGFETNPTPVTFNAFVLNGTGVQNMVHGGFFEQFTNIVFADNSAGGCSYSGFAFRDCKITGGVTDNRMVSASSQNTSNLFFLNMLFDGVTINNTNTGYSFDLLMNSHGADSSQINVAFKHNIFLQRPTTAVFHTDDSRCRVVCADNQLISTTTVLAGAGVLAGADACNSNGVYAGVTLHGGVDGLAPVVGDSANVLALRNANNAQTLKIYDKFTDASNYERLSLSKSGVAVIQTEHAGTGSAKNLILNSDSGAVFIQCNGTNTYEFAASNLFFLQDNTTNFGNPGSLRPKTLFAATSFQADILGTATNVSGNFGSASVICASSYWNGSAAASDTWTIKSNLGSGTTPTSTLDIAHSGSSGLAGVKFDCPVGFNSTAPVAKPTITGAKLASDTVMANLLTALANMGLLTDSTT